MSRKYSWSDSESSYYTPKDKKDSKSFNFEEDCGVICFLSLIALVLFLIIVALAALPLIV